MISLTKNIRRCHGQPNSSDAMVVLVVNKSPIERRGRSHLMRVPCARHICALQNRRAHPACTLQWTGLVKARPCQFGVRQRTPVAYLTGFPVMYIWEPVLLRSEFLDFFLLDEAGPLHPCQRYKRGQPKCKAHAGNQHYHGEKNASTEPTQE